jgi:hypothetical protein
MRRIWKGLLFMLIVCIGSATLHAQEEKYIGLFIYNFTKYFDWPDATKSGDFTIQVLGHKSVHDELVRLTAGKKVGSQDVIIQEPSSVQDIKPCQMVFIGHWQSRLLPDILGKIGDNPTLIITEMEGMLDQGSAINFVIREGTIKFEVKTSNATRRQLKVDPRIRELAFRVVD